MKKLTSILAAALALVACAPAEDPADQYRKALPTSETLAIETSGADESTTPAAGLVAKSMTVDGKSEYAVTSYLFARAVNGGVASFLWLIHSITWWPATSCDDDSCTWGPGSGENDLNVFKLVVTRSGGEHYDYVLSAARKDTGGTDFVTLVDGWANRGAFAHRGDGQFKVYFDNDALLDHPDFMGNPWMQTEFGTLDVAYDTHGELENQVVWLNSKNNEPDAPVGGRVNVYFDFNSNARDLLIAFRTLDGLNKRMSLHTQWVSTGEGRADAWYTDANIEAAFEAGTLPVDHYQKTECWAGPSADSALNFQQVYTSDPNVGAGEPAGDVGLCRGVEDFVSTLPGALYP